MMKKLVALLVGIPLVVFLLMQVPGYISRQVEGQIYQSLEDVPPRDAALVLGAKVYADEILSDVLRDRVSTAMELYQNGKVKTLIVSGYVQGTYNEPKVMKDYMRRFGIPEEAIVSDFEGEDTYDSVKNAEAAGYTSLIIVSQNYHLPRALYIANQLGMDSVGLSADLQEYYEIETYESREKFAIFKAILETHL